VSPEAEFSITAQSTRLMLPFLLFTAVTTHTHKKPHALMCARIDKAVGLCAWDKAYSLSCLSREWKSSLKKPCWDLVGLTDRKTQFVLEDKVRDVYYPRRTNLETSRCKNLERVSLSSVTFFPYKSRYFFSFAFFSFSQKEKEEKEILRFMQTG
jgi:hypothetical protein